MTKKISSSSTLNQYERIRLDHQKETAEDYVELIESLIAEKGEARAVELATSLGISQVSVSKTLQRLQKEGYVALQPYRSIFLTEKGADLAKSSRHRHQLVVKFLKVLGIPENVAETDAEGIEHHVSEITLNAMHQFIDQHQKNL